MRLSVALLCVVWATTDGGQPKRKFIYTGSPPPGLDKDVIVAWEPSERDFDDQGYSWPLSQKICIAANAGNVEELEALLLPMIHQDTDIDHLCLFSEPDSADVISFEEGRTTRVTAILCGRGASPLEIAVYHSRAEVVDVLLHEVAPRQSRHQLLYDAARRGHERVVYSLLTDGREDVNLRDKTTGVTPMWAAAEKRARSSGRMALNLGGC